MDDTSRFWTEEVKKVEVRDRVAHICLSYPECGENPHTIQVGLSAVRAADDIRIRYDFDRDGWVIQQQEGEFFEDTDGSLIPGVDGEWREVAFVQAFGLTAFHKKGEMDPAEWDRRLDEACRQSLEAKE